jgi:hypothetical protein
LWSQIEESPPPEGWLFSSRSPHWLYDEIDLEGNSPYLPRYWHRILRSDGAVLAVPFLDVVVQSFSEHHPETAIVIKKRA